MNSKLHTTAALCLWPPHERFTIGTSEGVRNFLVQDVPGDGNCFFHCLSVAMDGGLADSKMLRNIICGFILQNWQDWESEVTLFHDNITSKLLYSHKMIQQNGWATSAEIKAAAIILKCQINIWFEVTRGYALQKIQPLGQPLNTYDIRLQNNHFQFLKPLCPGDLSANSTPSSTCHYFDSSKNTFAQRKKKSKKLFNLKQIYQIPYL